MTRTLQAVSASAAVACALTWAGWATAQTVELRYATSAPPKTVWEMQVQRFQKQVEETSKGTLKINAFLNSQLGSEQDTVAQVARGRINSGGYSITAGSLLVPEIALLNIPFLFKDQKEQDCVYDNHVTKITQDMFLKKGVVMTGWSEVGVADIIGKKPYIIPDDLKGLKARAAPTKIGGFMWSQFGANPNPLPVTEWNSAFQTGLIDVAELGADLLLLLRPLQAGPRRDQDRALRPGRRGARQQGRLRQAVGRPEEGAGCGERHDAGVPAACRGARLRGQDPRDAQGAGGTIVELTPEQRAVWRKGVEAAWPKMVAAVGGEANAYWKAIQDGIKACSP